MLIAALSSAWARKPHWQQRKDAWLSRAIDRLKENHAS
jgi:hypothetical protein